VNLVVADSDYIDFLSVPGRATLIGKEKVRWENRAERMCWFVRHYERMHEQWRITFAQWTISTSDGKGSPPSALAACSPKQTRP
jgi:hypothetical protein